jgi:hypothetical protein
MQAIRVHHFGGLDSLVAEDVPRPAPGDGEVLLRVKAAGVGPWDALVRSGQSVLPQPLPLTLGSDVSGLVEHVGAGVSQFRTGECSIAIYRNEAASGLAAAVPRHSVGTRERYPDRNARAAVRVDCTRAEPAADRHHFEVWYLLANAGKRSPQPRRRAGSLAAHPLPLSTTWPSSTVCVCRGGPPFGWVSVTTKERYGGDREQDFPSVHP